MNSLRLETQKFIPKIHFLDMINFFKEHKINTLHFLFRKTLKLKFKLFDNLSGSGKNNINDDSKIIKINLRNDEYEARIYEYDDDYTNSINFIKIHSVANNNNEFNEDDHCGVILIDKENNATIQSIDKYNDCLKCINNKKFKTGEVLMQIMIGICVYKNIKKIQLIDNSNITCGNEQIPLIYLRTITHGVPYYTKFNMFPINHNDIKNKENISIKNELKTFNDNLNIFKNKPSISKEEFIKLLNYKIFDNKSDKHLIKYINEILMPRINKYKNYVLISEIIYKIGKDNNEVSCELLHNILMDVYKICGYLKYKYKHFEITLNKNQKDIIKTHISFTNI